MLKLLKAMILVIINMYSKIKEFTHQPGNIQIKNFGGVPSSTFNTTRDYIFHPDFIKSHAFVGWFDKPENVDNLKAYD